MKKDILVGESSMCGRKNGRKCRKTEKEMHEVKGEYLQKEVGTEERKCFTEANT